MAGNKRPTTISKTPPKGVRRLSDVNHARAHHAYILAAGDLERTYRSLSPKIPKRTLEWYRRSFRWDLPELVSDAVEDAAAKRSLDLKILRRAKASLADQVENLTAKDLGQAVRALVDVIEAERKIMGNTDGADDDKTPGLFKWLVEAMGLDASVVLPGNGKGNGDGGLEDDDPFGIR